MRLDRDGPGRARGLRPALVARLAWLFRRWRADVVHTHNTKALVYGGPAAPLVRGRSGP